MRGKTDYRLELNFDPGVAFSDDEVKPHYTRTPSPTAKESFDILSLERRLAGGLGIKRTYQNTEFFGLENHSFKALLLKLAL